MLRLSKLLDLDPKGLNWCTAQSLPKNVLKRWCCRAILATLNWGVDHLIIISWLNPAKDFTCLHCINLFCPFLCWSLIIAHSDQKKNPQKGVNTPGQQCRGGVLIFMEAKRHRWSHISFLFLKDVTHYTHNWMRMWRHINLNSQLKVWWQLHPVATGNWRL